VEAPIARPVVPENSSSTVTPNDDTTENGAIVMCLSCHRAHGSDQPDLLRWAYAGMQAGTGTADTGCFVCHTTKNGD
jgi:predicted CXXCH cytochrome family protein